jgi:hypothetical protein
MDVHPYTPHKKHDDMLVHHRATWNGLLRAGLYGLVGIIILLALMATFLTKHS